jgi:hypothetical protein
MDGQRLSRNFLIDSFKHGLITLRGGPKVLSISTDKRPPEIYRFDRHKLASIMACGLLLLSCGASTVDQAALFHSNKPLRKGQEIVGLGTVGGLSNNKGHADLSLIRIANCRGVESVGDFDVVLDGRGKEIAERNAGKLIKFRGLLTGNSTIGMTFAPNANIQSETGSMVSARIPELMVSEFHEVSGSEIGCGKQ